MWWVIGRSILLVIFLGGAVTIAGITQTDLSTDWLYSNGKYPLLSCPSVDFMVGENRNVDGSQCKLLFSADDPTWLPSIDPGMVVTDGGYYGTIVSSRPCGVAQGLVNPSKCQFQTWSDDYPWLSAPCQFNVSPVCNAAGTVTVGQIVSLRGMLTVSALLVAIYFVVSTICVIHTNKALVPNRQRRLDSSRASADASAKEMSRMIEREWSYMESEQSMAKAYLKGGSSSHRRSGTGTDSVKNFPSLVAETGNLKGSNYMSGPREAFGSSQWRAKVMKCLGSEAKARRRVDLTLFKIRTGITVGLVFFIFTVGIAEMILYALPRNYYQSTPRSVMSVLFFDWDLFGSALTSLSSWVDFLVIADLVAELFLLLVSFAIVLQWPQIPVKVPHLVRVRNGIRRGGGTDLAQAAADGAIYADTICVVILTRENSCSESRRQSLAKRVQNLLAVFPPDSIFVVDSHPHSSVPVDTTWQTVWKMSPLIRYCFVPDCDSKIFALDWFNTVWLPFLCRSGQSQQFTHMLVLSAVDDETSLPHIPLDLTIPRENLILNVDTLRALHIPVTAVAANSCCVVHCQDFEYKFRAIRRLAESKIGSCVETEILAGTAWERDALHTAIRGSTTKDVSSLSQLKCSLEIIKMRSQNHVKSNPFAFIQLGVPSSTVDLMNHRIRNGSAGEAVKCGSAFVEMSSLISLCNVFSWSIKPFLLFGTLLSGFCQLARPFVIGTLIFRDPLTIAGLLVGAGMIIFLEEIILLVVFAGRLDLRQKWSLAPILMFPVYRWFSCWVMETTALFYYIFGGCVSNASLRPEKRFRELHDAPACPPSHVVNWFSVWKTDDDTLTDTGIDYSDDFDDSVFSSTSGLSPQHRR